MTIDQYISNINQRYKLGNATEHTFRGDLQLLIESTTSDIQATNEPKRQSCGAPDYILTRKDIPVGFIEAKDIGDKDLEGAKKTGNKEQFDRYKASLGNLIFTDYLRFRLYREGEFITEVAIGEVAGNEIKPLPQNFSTFENLIKDFCIQISQTIKSPKRLAEMMAGKARLLSDIIEKALTSDEDRHEDSTLKEQMMAFKEILIHDITPKGFADVYAQTIAYGMFAARLHDPTLPTFSRQEAAELIPKTNPFLRKLFGYIAGPDIDDRIKWVVDSLVDVFLACNVEQILKNYGRSTKMEDPIIHFYETFLSEYDPKLRKARGVWYTPQPVVNFIVRAVDDILKTEFNLPQGLADTSKTKIKVKDVAKATSDMRSKTKQIEREEEVHRVQILDPATGTGTFLAEVIKLVHKKFEGQQGIWSNYVETHLLPRLNGFELLMASYAMAHLKLDLLLTETGFKPTKEQRFKIFLTNSLEEHHPDTGTLFASWLSTEANEANRIKRDTPVMCIIGNPPYSGESANKGEWIMSLMEEYKKEPGGNEKLKERNPKWINDDYVKFLRYGQHFIEKNGSGILAFINPHGFLDNPTFRGMRWNLLKTYDKIYTIDLHGNSKKKETAPDGGIDENVFDIMQGVSINIFIKTGEKQPNELGKVYHFDLYGERESKYDFLQNNSLKTIRYTELTNISPDYFFTYKNFDQKSEYNNSFLLNDLFVLNGVGMTTAHDEFVIKEKQNELLLFYQEFQNSERDAKYLHSRFSVKEKNGWDIIAGYDNIKNSKDLSSYINSVTYRPFDNRFIFYEDKLVWRTVRKVMRHFFKPDNLGLVVGRQGQVVGSMPWNLIFLTTSMTDFNIFYRGGGMLFPLYLYPEKSDQQTIDQSQGRIPNLNPEIIKQIAEKLEIPFLPEPESESANSFSPIDLLDYIYAVLHSPAYREKYKEFLKIDFPRLPYPNKESFLQLVKLGGKLRQIHLMESPVVEQFITQYSMAGDNVVGKIRFERYHYDYVVLEDGANIESPESMGNVYINDTQYFANVPEKAWNFYIGGYQPAQKWLKDRKDRTLDFEDILHYQKIIVALSETDRIMKEIDLVEVE